MAKTPKAKKVKGNGDFLNSGDTIAVNGILTFKVINGGKKLVVLEGEDNTLLIGVNKDGNLYGAINKGKRETVHSL